MTKTYEATSHIEINAPARVCYDILCDYERYPEWFKYVNTVDIKEYGEDGRPVVVFYRFDVALKQGFTILQTYSYDDQNLVLHFESAGGDFKKSGGYFKFIPGEDENTRVEYMVHVTLGFPVPQRVVDYVVDYAMKDVLKNLKSEAEKKM
ncbi:MAG: type II toxin-antitoxin system RatA family toxin [Spirochaetota bacterium]